MLQSLRTQSFRCLEDGTREFAPGAHFFIGPNGSGKTSLLEAICVLLRLQSPRTSKLAHCARFGGSVWALKGVWQNQESPDKTRLPSELHVAWSAEAGRKAALDGKPQNRTAEYLSIGRVAWFGNTDIELVRGSSAGRRRYLDFLCSQLDPAYLPALRAYERALRARNLLLKENRPWREILALSEPLAAAGQRVSEARRSALALINPAFQKAAEEIGSETAAALLDEPGSSGPLADALEASRRADSAARTTTCGPHRDDFTVLLAKGPASHFGSEGQQRTLALALKLAQARLLEQATGAAPLLLLDDIFGELDPIRRNRLLDALPPHAQMFITTTSLSWRIPGKPCTIWHVENGSFQIHPLPSRS